MIRLVMYSVFGDESYDERRQRVFAVGGIIGDENDWTALSQKWVSITGGEEFHANKWDVQERKEQYKQLVKALAETKLHGFGAVMSLDGYDTIFPNAIDYLPYYECFLRVIEHFAYWTRLSLPRGTVNFTFDQNLEVQYHASKLYHHILSNKEWSDREFVSDEITYSNRRNPKIQAADLWAREIMKHVDNAIGPVRRPMRLSMKALREHSRFGFDVYERSYFESLKKRLDALSQTSSNFEKYRRWIKERNMQDNTENRMHYMFQMDAKDRGANVN